MLRDSENLLPWMQSGIEKYRKLTIALSDEHQKLLASVDFHSGLTPVPSNGVTVTVTHANLVLRFLPPSSRNLVEPKSNIISGA